MGSDASVAVNGPLANKSYAPVGDGVLAEYDSRTAEEADFWDDHWSSHRVQRSLSRARGGDVGGMEFLLERLPRQGRILEAGCGIGQLVAALAARGYDVEGVDFATRALDAARSVLPGLPVRHGDLRRLDVADGAYACYLSLGVIEHFERPEALAPLMREARRVTRGVFFFSVPYLSPGLQRRLDAGELPRRRPEGAFYQYYFTRSAFERLLADHGLEPIAFAHYATLVGLQRHHALIRRIYARLRPLQSVMRRARKTVDQRYGPRYAHMIGAWCR